MSAAAVERVDPFPYGEGWMTSNARDLCRIMCALGGCDAAELLDRIVKHAGASDHTVNTATVEHVLSDWCEEER